MMWLIYPLLLCRSQKFSEEQAFVGYQKDTPAAIVFQASKQLERLRSEDSATSVHWKYLQEHVLQNIGHHQLVNMEVTSKVWKETVCGACYIELYIKQKIHTDLFPHVGLVLESIPSARDSLSSCLVSSDRNTAIRQQKVSQ